MMAAEKLIQSRIIFGFTPGQPSAMFCVRLRIWWNWQTRYFEVVVPQGVQVQVLLCAPFFQLHFFFNRSMFSAADDGGKFFQRGGKLLRVKVRNGLRELE